MESNKCDPSFKKGFKDGHRLMDKKIATMTDKMPVIVIKCTVYRNMDMCNRNYHYFVQVVLSWSFASYLKE